VELLNIRHLSGMAVDLSLGRLKIEMMAMCDNHMARVMSHEVLRGRE
jgi:hypothetical protein